MGLFDRLFGRDDQQAPPGPPARRPRTDDEIAVERYEYLLRTAPPETIERVHTEAFAKLTPQQRDILFDKLTSAYEPSERPADAQPASLAQAATRAELQQPGTLRNTLGSSALGGGAGGLGFGGMVGSSLLGTVAGYVIGSALVSAFMPMAWGGDQADAGADSSGDAAADPQDGGAGDATATGYDDGSADQGFDGGDFGGGDFF